MEPHAPHFSVRAREGSLALYGSESDILQPKLKASKNARV